MHEDKQGRGRGRERERERKRKIAEVSEERQTELEGAIQCLGGGRLSRETTLPLSRESSGKRSLGADYYSGQPGLPAGPVRVKFGEDSRRAGGQRRGGEREEDEGV